MAGPLQGLKVLDFSTLLPGPYASQLLADWGAEVLRIEAPDRPDLMRSVPPHIDGISAAFAAITRGKQTLQLDLKQADSRAEVHELLKDYDILLEQFRPGVMARLELDYQTLSEVNPRLIYCSITGYGQSGPLSARAGHDINYLALSGVASYSGREHTGPVLSGVQIADVAGGSHYAVMSILAAVIERERSGLGQHLDISMTDCAMALNILNGPGTLVTGKSPGPGREQLNGGGLYDYYQTSDGRYLSVGSLEPQFVQQLFEAVERPEWLPRAGKPEEVPKLKQELQALLASQTLDYWQARFAKFNACVEPVLSLSEALAQPHAKARGMVKTVTLPNGQQVEQIASPVKFADR